MRINFLLVSQYTHIKDLILHGNLHSRTICKLLWFYNVCHFCSIDKAIIYLNHLELLVKWEKNQSHFLCQENIWYFTLNLSGKVQFSISIKSIISLSLKINSVKTLWYWLVSLKKEKYWPVPVWDPFYHTLYEKSDILTNIAENGCMWK